MNKFIFNKLIVLTPSINAINLFVGFALYTTIFYGYNTDFRDTRNLTIVYHLISLSLALFVIVHNKKWPKLSIYGNLFIFLWLVYIIRIIFDLFIREGNYYLDMNQKLIYITDSIVACFIPTIALFFSFKNINIKFVINSIFVILLIIVTYGLFNITYDLTYGLSNITHNFYRFKMNAAQNELNFGYYSASLALAGLSLLKASPKNIYKLFMISAIIIGVVGVGTAGSRGPFSGFLFAIFLPILLKRKFTMALMLLLLLFIYFIFAYFNNEISQLVYQFFPVLYERIYETISTGDTGRASVFMDAIDQITSHPFLGDWHLLYVQSGEPNTSHNIFLSTIMSLGLFVGSVIIILYYHFIKSSINLILPLTTNSFIGYISLLSIIYSLTTGGDLVYKQVFNFAFAMLILFASPTVVKQN